MKWVSDDSLEVYVDSIFKQSVTFSKFVVQDVQQRKTMMQRAQQGFEYCKKMWLWAKSKAKMECDENLKYVDEMLNLMTIRISQMK